MNFPVDISPLVSEKIGVFPGDQKFSRTVSMDMANGDHLGLSSIQTTLHLGAHTDAPNHYAKEAPGIDGQDLQIYYGPCQVIEVSDADVSSQGRIGPTKHIFEDLRPGVRRVLFKTGSFPDPDQWNSDFWSLSPKLVDLLASEGVRLVGIDTPSIDPEQSKELESHRAVAANGLAILEGVVLDGVEAGVYSLISLPLKLEGADASPVRAILLPEGAIKEPLVTK